MRISLPKEKKIQNRALRKLCCRLSGMGKTLAVGLVAVLGLVAAGKLNFAYAVNMDGDVIGYVSSREELDAIVEDVQQSVSGALGREWNAPELKTHVMLGESGMMAEENGDTVADRLLETASEVSELCVVYADGRSVCAFETPAEAEAAILALRDRYVKADTEAACFAERVVFASGMADRKLLEGNLEALDAAVTVVTTSRVTVETVLPFDSEIRTDDGMFDDESYVSRPGIEGLDVAEYLVTSRDGTVSEYAEICFNHYAPVTEVVVVGTRTRRSTGSYVWPVDDAYISSSFGYRVSIGSSNHQGLDLANDAGTPIHAADGGEVIYADAYKGFGLIVKIQHDNGDVTYYAHCSRILVEVGQYVTQGEEIAKMGATGVATGNHLHFELHPGGGDAVNPMDYLPPCDFEYLD